MQLSINLFVLSEVLSSDDPVQGMEERLLFADHTPGI